MKIQGSAPTHRPKVILGVVAIALFSAACSGSKSSGAPTTTAAATNSAYDLAGICPNPIVIQTDWYSEADHSEAYELASGAATGTVDNSKKTYTAEMIVQGHDTGVKVQVRTGGPATGNQLVSAIMYEDSSILLGFVDTDEQIELSNSQPTVAVVAPRQTPATIIMWSPTAHPQAKTIADLGAENVTILVFPGAPYIDYLVGKGILHKSEIDSSYNGTPARFVASGGTVAQQGFATAEPYEYQYEITQWMKPVAYQLVSATGYNPYPESLVTMPGNVTKYAACFKKLVPIIQQAQVDYVANPVPADNLIVKLVTEYNNGWSYNAGEAAYAAKAQVTNGIIANGPDGVLGDFDFSRIQQLMNIVEPIYVADGKTVKAGLTPQQLVTNQFIDPSIHLPASAG